MKTIHDMKKLLIFLLFLLLYTSSFSQVELRGRILSSEGLKPMSDVKVLIVKNYYYLDSGTTSTEVIKQTITNSEGYFYITSSTNKGQLTLKHYGYNDKSISYSRSFIQDKKIDLANIIMEYTGPLKVDYGKQSIVNSNIKGSTIHLLPIGVGIYYENYMLNNVDFATRGANHIKDIFERQGLIDVTNPLTDKRATRTSIISTLNTFSTSNTIKENDLLILYFSGHGLSVEGKVGICPADYKGPLTLISHDTIVSILKKSVARHIVCLIESCKNETTLSVDPSSIHLLEKLRSIVKPGLIYITSCSLREKSYGNPGELGYFTEALSLAFTTKNADSNSDNIITIRELFSFVREHTRQKTSNQQNPEMIINGTSEELPIFILK